MKTFTSMIALKEKLSLSNRAPGMNIQSINKQSSIFSNSFRNNNKICNRNSFKRLMHQHNKKSKSIIQNNSIYGFIQEKILFPKVICTKQRHNFIKDGNSKPSGTVFKPENSIKFKIFIKRKRD